MRDRVSYEWAAELVEDGIVVDADFSDRLDELDADGAEVVLVRSLGNPYDGVTHRERAYPGGAGMPERFDGGARVPVRFAREYARWLAGRA